MLNPLRLSVSRVSLARGYSVAARGTTRVYSRTYKKPSPVVKPATTASVEATEEQEEPSSAVEEADGKKFALHDSPLEINTFPQATGETINWSDSFHGLGSQPFPKETNEILLAPISPDDIEIKPDGLLYLPEIKYRRILNRAFGPGGWGLAPRTETYILPGQLSREYGLICHGRLVSIARGEQDYFGGEEKITTALEGCKSNALMRCCKDLGIASELWDPSFIRAWKKKYCEEVFVEHVNTKKKKKLWKLKSIKTIDYPYKAL
ncbi:hypothetical protein SBY92_005401 [Candida maltosa Xu316]|uniref:Mitochondrial genome maintenance protein MGM101 n=1 Tax=Candida maltosa (strain Xu316) TaxID=1245528 RepID=M3JWA2_CANMX|nr:protein MGM101 [Candida maltosa Xu316]